MFLPRRLPEDRKGTANHEPEMTARLVLFTIIESRPQLPEARGNLPPLLLGTCCQEWDTLLPP